MHRRFLIILAVVALFAVTGVAVGLVETRAQGEPQLATITPAQLLANVVQHATDIRAVSGDVSWKNDVLGLSMLSFGGQGTGDLSALLTNGSGRVWVQGGKARLEIQGMAGDTTIVGDSTGDSTSVWVYTYASNMATEYTLPARVPARAGAADQTGTTQPPGSESSGAEQAPQTTPADPVAAIDSFIQKLAPEATLAVSDSVNVAGRGCYVLSLIPKATNTVFGSAQVAIDSETYLPLKLDLYAKGMTKPVLTAGFTSISYEKLDEGVFGFTPPPNATVQHKTLNLPTALTDKLGGEAGSTARTQVGGETEQTPLTLAEAAAKAGFTPAVSHISDPALAFAGASVIPAKAMDLQSLLDQLRSGALGSGVLGSAGPDSAVGGSAQQSPVEGSAASTPVPASEVNLGPTVIQRYGQGFGTIALVEMKVPSEVTSQLVQTLGAIPLISRTGAGGVTIYQLNTALGSAALWSNDGLLFLAAGSVSQTDLMGFIASVR